MDQSALDPWLTPLDRLLLAYAPARERVRYAASFAMDRRLGEPVRISEEPLLTQIRLAWWRDRLNEAEGNADSGDPLLDALRKLQIDLRPAADLVDAWEALHLSAGTEDGPTLPAAVSERGRALFALAGGKAAGRQAVQDWAGLWSGWDWLRRLHDPERVADLWNGLRERINNRPGFRGGRRLRPLSMLCMLAYRDRGAARPSETVYRPGVAARLVWHGLTNL